MAVAWRSARRWRRPRRGWHGPLAGSRSASAPPRATAGCHPMRPIRSRSCGKGWPLPRCRASARSVRSRDGAPLSRAAAGSRAVCRGAPAACGAGAPSAVRLQCRGEEVRCADERSVGAADRPAARVALKGTGRVLGGIRQRRREDERWETARAPPGDGAGGRAGAPVPQEPRRVCEQGVPVGLIKVQERGQPPQTGRGQRGRRGGPPHQSLSLTHSCQRSRIMSNLVEAVWQWVEAYTR